MGETAEQAVIREVTEELSVTPKIDRPLWLNQAFLPRMWTAFAITNCAFTF
ncbi:MAG: NUDIX domain-containing protein [Christensenellales bacterium]